MHTMAQKAHTTATSQQLLKSSASTTDSPTPNAPTTDNETIEYKTESDQPVTHQEGTNKLHLHCIILYTSYVCVLCIH